MITEKSIRKLLAIQSALAPSFYFGSLHREERMEQLLCAHFIKPEERVLEFGGNIGRCSCIIASILYKPHEQLVVIECNPNLANKLYFNSIMNRFHFKIEEAALSNRPLFFTEKKLNSHTHTKKKKGSIPIKTIKYQDFRKKYGEFTTLVIDCEGAFFSILSEFPAILNGVSKMIIENDFTCRSHYEKMVSILRAQGFLCILSLSTDFSTPCQDCFHQVYQR
jgi:FkbM family methyltransferase